jgi:hypothetical protein
VLDLASHTGWPLSEILSLGVSDFIFWLEGLPKHGEQ